MMRISMKKNKVDFVKWVATLAIFMLKLQIGLIYGWMSPNVAWLLSPKSPIPMTTSDISWMMSIATLGYPVGSVIGSVLVEYLGSRKTVLATYLISAVSWTCLLFANSVEWIYVARFISSLPVAMTNCCFALYLSEVTEPTSRGTVISLALIGLYIGSLLGITAETYLPKKVTSPIYLSEALVGAAIFCWLKDTPYILAKNDNVDDARKSIEFYHEISDVSKELEAVRLFVEKGEGIGDKLKKFRSASVRKSMFVLCLLFGMPHLCGSGIMLGYIEVIITNAKVDIIKPAECVIYATVITIIASFSTFKLSDKLGRKFLLVTSSVGTVISLISLGLHFHLLQSDFDAKTLQWLPMISVVVFFVSYSVGYGLIPNTLLSEMFPENIKSLAACATTMSGSFFAFAVTKVYQPIVDVFGDACAFWIFAILSATGIPIVLFLLIETKGKTFQQIQDELVMMK